LLFLASAPLGSIGFERGPRAYSEALNHPSTLTTATRVDLSAHVETLKTQLAGAEGRAAAESARASEESAKTAQAIAAFESLAQRLEAMAAQRAIKPWWRRLAG
jgi:hypothetical protein